MKPIQIQVCQGADNAPFITILTDSGRMFTSFNLVGKVEFIEIPFDLDDETKQRIEKEDDEMIKTMTNF